MNKSSLSFPAKNQRGQSLVELALSMMVILMLLAGAINFGVGFFSYVAIRDAAQEGALYGSIDPTGNIEGRVRSSSARPVDLADTTAVQVNISIQGSACAGGNPPNLLTVVVTYDCPVTMPLAGIFIGDHITLTASATSTILKPECP